MWICRDVTSETCGALCLSPTNSDFRFPTSYPVSGVSVGLAVSRLGGLPQSKSACARCTKALLGAGIREEETLAVVSRVDGDGNGRRVFEFVIRNS